VKRAKTRAKRVAAVAVRLDRGARTLAVRRESGGLLGGLWELPGAELARGEKPLETAARMLIEQLGLEPLQLSEVGRVKHLFTHRDMTLHVMQAQAGSGRVRRSGFSEHRWVRPANLGGLPIATLTRKALGAFDETATSGARAGEARSSPGTATRKRSP